MKVCYIPKNFGEPTLKIIDAANAVLVEYLRQGFELTLRGLYYKFIGRDLFPDSRFWRWTGDKWVRATADEPGATKNSQPNYKWFGEIMNDARLAGLVDWDYISDMTRNLRGRPHWSSPGEIIESCAAQFSTDRWATQANYVEVWVEKDAQVSVIRNACQPLDVPYFSCRGYTSQSEMREAALRLIGIVQAGRKPHIIHLGDHDPSGVDMTRDIQDRIELFMVHHIAKNWSDNQAAAGRTVSRVDLEAHIQDTIGHQLINRIALNKEQIARYNPPPSPAKSTDSRSAKYIDKRGSQDSWELDALEPAVVTAIITATIRKLITRPAMWKATEAEEKRGKALLKKCAKNWGGVTQFLEEKA